jgi:hypothetical protein
MDLPSQPRKTILYVLLIALITLLITAGFLYQKQEHARALETHKSVLIKRMAQIIKDYKRLDAQNDSLQFLLQANTNELVYMIDSVAGLSQIGQLQSRDFELTMKRFQQEADRLHYVVDSLRVANSRLKDEQARAMLSLNKERRRNDSLQIAVSKASGLSITNLSSTAINVRSSGDRPTNSAWRAEKIQACFTIPANSLAVKGVRKVYLRIVNPDLKIYREDGSAISDTSEVNLFYSASKTLVYKGEAIETCLEYPNDDLDDGTYLVQIYLEGEKKAEQKLLLD